jgi:predicted RNA-binding protein associated with RNAse of E/G family
VDAVDRVRISAEGVRYRDLLLDAWVTPERTVHLEDEHDVAAATVSGQLTFYEQRRVARTRLLFTRAWSRIEARVDAAIAEAIAVVEGGREPRR